MDSNNNNNNQSFYQQNVLVSEYSLLQGQILASPNRNYFATVLNDGAFTVYVSSHFCAMNAIFSSKPKPPSHARSPFSLKCQNDGNVVLFDGKGTPQWATNSWGKGSGPYRLILQDDGNLVVKDAEGLMIWNAECGRG